MALQGAEVLLYPTAIGSEPEAAGSMDTSAMWQRVMIGHAVANACYLGAANRVGTEVIEDVEQSFYGASFICDFTGEKIAEAGRIGGSRARGGARSRHGASISRRNGLFPGPATRPVRAVAHVRRADAPIGSHGAMAASFSLGNRYPRCPS